MTGPRHNVDYQVKLAWTRIALARALEAAAAAGVLRLHDGENAAAAFIRYVERQRPVILIETPMPFAEVLVADIVHELGSLPRARPLISLLTGQPEAAPEIFGNTEPVVVSLHEAGVQIGQSELARELPGARCPVFLGCASRHDVAEGLRRSVDLTITLPTADEAHFLRVFETLFGGPFPDGAQDEIWRDFVLPTDLQQPLRLGHDRSAAADYIRTRVRERLARQSPESGPSLADLHGLGEARAIATDLVADLRLALDGELDWDEVDRGMLMSGPPGTGKTTLARAIARDAGVKFVVASATDWQAAGHLYLHLDAIRASFDEARRYPAAILFIDEIDAVGSREQLGAHGRGYQTQVINYLLELLDGFQRRSRLVVIGATNYEESVDPALRRAGRLDRTVRVSYPTIAALGHIYDYHLGDHRAAGRVRRDVDVAELAGLSFGLTGADVELFVRGAARRARKRREPIAQQDLVAEILRRPRSGVPRQPIPATLLRRYAVHEAGHTLARLRSRTAGADIAYVSVAPRSDGRIGFLAAMPDQRASLTREDILEQLGIILAGRAAEEIVYGADGVSDLAGCYEPFSDLARATRLATLLVGSTGLGAGRGLTWWPALEGADDETLDREVDAELSRVYAQSVRRLRAEARLLQAIADALAREQELTGDELRQLMRAAAVRD
ncbi:AAA family ATPase [Lentisalinibacter orientalis]|uniref:AAA family ATPase n=1 Tax=Lentisalinibacter orientalis TaxID=2992241 RepID=UPI00386C31CD